MNVRQNVSLQPYNTFRVDVRSRYFIRITSVEELQALLQHPVYGQQPKLVLGGGSNLLFTQDFEGIVLKMDIPGIRVVEENSDHVWVKVGAGVGWHTLVLHCIEQGYGGLENLSLIPGTVGAAPMQNIGAYGVETKDVFETLEAVHMADATLRTFNNAACAFGYRDSVFKQALKGQYIITSVTFKLHKKPLINVSYGAIQETLLQTIGERSPSIKDISDAVIRIRQSKLPDPAVIGNAGSFFKNPVISRAQYDALKVQYPEAPGYVLSDDSVKVPAGWLIEHAGWKGKRVGEVGVHDRQALVLVNHGKAVGKEVWSLALQIQASVKETFGIDISPEVNVV